MIHKLQKTFCLVVFLCTGIFFSRCQNEDAEFDNKEPAVISAKKWFENNNLNMEALAFTESIDWENAILTKAENKNAIEVPLILNENTTTNVVEDLDYRTYMRLLFVQDTEDNYEVYDIVYTTKNPAFDNNSKAFSLHNIGRDFSGYITLQNSQNKIIYSAQYEKGEQTTLHNNTSKGAIASKLVCTYYVTVGPYTTCSNWVYMPDDTVIPGFYPPGMGGGPIPPMVTPAWQNSVLNLPQVNLKISNRSEYLKCFDPNATGVLHVYIDQPVPNNAIAYTMNSGVPDVGHTFLALEQNGNVSVIGYYPNDGVNPFTSQLQHLLMLMTAGIRMMLK